MKQLNKKTGGNLPPVSVRSTPLEFTMRRFVIPAVAMIAFAFVGCGPTVPDPGEEVDVTGTVTGVDLAKAKTQKLKLHLLPTGGKARPAQFDLDSTGKFSGKMIKGPYRYQINGPEGSDSLMKGIPESIQQGDMKRSVDISGGAIEIKF